MDKRGVGYQSLVDIYMKKASPLDVCTPSHNLASNVPTTREIGLKFSLDINIRPGFGASQTVVDCSDIGPLVCLWLVIGLWDP